MTIYGTKIISDIDFPLDLSRETQTRYEVTLSADIPLELKQSIACGFYLYWAQGHDVLLPNYLYMFLHLLFKRRIYLSKMLNTISMFRVFVPWDLERLDEVHDRLAEYSKGMQ